MRKIFFCGMAAVCMLAGSCSFQKTADDALSGVKTENLKAETLNDSFAFGFANKMLVYDTLLIIYDVLQDEKLQFFSKTSGQHLGSFGRIGQGDKEVISPSNISVSTRAGLFSLYDYDRGTLLACPLERLGKLDPDDWFTIHVPDYPIRPHEIAALGEGAFVSMHGKPRLAITKDGSMTEFDDYPDLLDEDSQRMFMLTQSLWAVSPDGKKMVQATNIGSLMDIFRMDESGIIPVTEKCYHKPIFDVQKGQITPKPETVYGFVALSVTDDHVYATMHGVANPTRFPDSIFRFDWSGHPEMKFMTDQQIVSFCVDDNKVYAIVIGEDNEQRLVSMTL